MEKQNKADKKKGAGFSDLLQRQKSVDESGLKRLEESIRTNYHTGWRSEENYTADEYENDLKVHLYGRLERDRGVIIPWLNDARPFRGGRVLEIGCGTGSSSVAIAEQGAKLTAIDVDEGAMEVARDRCEIYGVEVEFRTLNASELPSAFGLESFDAVIFFASLEHMTLTERLAALEDAWGLLSPEGMLAIVETPNRLWFFDDHTSMLPFFHWLPDELAFLYSKFSDRKNFREIYRDYDSPEKEHFLRRGRGLSFHELEIAIRPVEEIEVLSSLSSFEGNAYRSRQSDFENRYKELLMSLRPNLHEGFFDGMLYLALKKN